MPRPANLTIYFHQSLSVHRHKVPKPVWWNADCRTEDVETIADMIFDHMPDEGDADLENDREGERWCILKALDILHDLQAVASKYRRAKRKA